MENFMQQLRAGQVIPDDINDFIDAWHTGNSTDSLVSFLGMTQAEYQAWVADPTSLTNPKSIDWNTELKIQQNIPEQHRRLLTLDELKEIYAEPSDKGRKPTNGSRMIYGTKTIVEAITKSLS